MKKRNSNQPTTTLTQVLRFIESFSGAEQTFLFGCCYWFAFILNSRFGFDIVYDPIDGHFLSRGIVLQASGEKSTAIFDIRGDVTGQYKDKCTYDIEWMKEGEPNWYTRLMRDCRDMAA